MALMKIGEFAKAGMNSMAFLLSGHLFQGSLKLLRLYSASAVDSNHLEDFHLLFPGGSVLEVCQQSRHQFLNFSL